MLILTRSEIANLLTFAEYVTVVEEAFRSHDEGRSLPPGLMHVDASEGEFHIKAGGLQLDEPWFGLKVNGGFFHNRERFGLPNIQGMIVLASASNGRPLALLDSLEITIQRTGAATALAARYLARPDSAIATVCGCGTQGRVQLRALQNALPIRKAFAYSLTDSKSAAFAAQMQQELGIEVEPTRDLAAALRKSDVCVTCTPAKSFFVQREHVPDGMFISAVGSDSPEKQELDPRILADAAVFCDLLDQAAAVGEWHHAVEKGFVRREAMHAELGELVSGKKAGRTTRDQITVFDSTGTALQDVAAAVAVYRRAVELKKGTALELSA
jgi:ornithine cyclodeaminase/alanine dehydrogenase